MSFVKLLVIELKTLVGIRQVPLCNRCKNFIAKEQKCGIYNNLNYSLARSLTKCGYVGYFYEKKDDFIYLQRCNKNAYTTKHVNPILSEKLFNK